jgi:hypothetical protein
MAARDKKGRVLGVRKTEKVFNFLPGESDERWMG